jgi:transcriptional regulator with XRE-family HTH domain
VRRRTQSTTRSERSVSPPPPSSSSAQRVREDLGRRLRELRVAAGLTATELGRRLGRHTSKVSRIEHGTSTPSIEDVTAWCDHCGAPERIADFIASLRALDDLWTDWERLEQGGFERAQVQFLDWFERAKTLRAYSSWLVPGVLQTEDYTLAVWRLIADRRGVEDDIETAMPLRQARKRCLYDGQHRFVVLIEESVLRSGFGGADVMLAQLAHLLSVSTLPSIALGIVPSRPDRAAWAVEDFWMFDNAQVNVELVCRVARGDLTPWLPQNPA